MRKFDYAMENFRAIAICFVVLSHSTLYPFLPVGKFLYFFFENATSFFVFISGYFLWRIDSHGFKFSLYLLRKFKKVIIPYFVICGFFVFVGLWWRLNFALDLNFFQYVIWSYVVGGSINFPLWFMPMIFIFFLISGVLINIANSGYIIFLLIASLVFSLFSARPFDNLNPFLAASHFFGYYVLGVVVAKCFALEMIFFENVSRQILAIFFGLFIFAVAYYLFNSRIILAEGFVARFGELNLIELGRLGLLISIYSICRVYLNFQSRILAYIANISFGIFFVHGMFVILFERILANFQFRISLFVLVVQFFFVMLFSILVIEVVRKVFPGRSHYVLGC